MNHYLKCADECNAEGMIRGLCDRLVRCIVSIWGAEDKDYLAEQLEITLEEQRFFLQTDDQ